MIECAAFHSESYEMNGSSEISDEPLKVGDTDWEEALAVESIKDLQVIIPGRESGYGSTSGYSGYSS